MSFKNQTFYQLKVKIFVSIFLLHLDMEMKQTALKSKELNCVLLKKHKEVITAPIVIATRT